MLLAEQSTQFVFLSELANMTTGLLEEDLELAAGGFSDSVDLLHQLLQERADVPLEERCLIRADGRENFWASLAFLDDHLNQARHGCHSLFSGF